LFKNHADAGWEGEVMAGVRSTGAPAQNGG